MNAMIRPRNFGLLASLLGCFCACRDQSLVPLQRQTSNSSAVPISLVVRNYSPSPGKILSDFFVRNFSVVLSGGRLTYSSSHDGLSDDQKAALQSQYGFTLGSPYSVNPILSDLLIFLLGVPMAQYPHLSCTQSSSVLAYQNSSKDGLMYSDASASPPFQIFLGLTDCEKLVLGLNPDLFDYNNSGIPDYLKLRCGLNPKNRNQHKLSLAGEQINNYEKCKRGIPIDESANLPENIGYAEFYTKVKNQNGLIDLTVKNIPYISQGKGNLLGLYWVENNLKSGSPSLKTAFSMVTKVPANQQMNVDYRTPHEPNNWEISFQ